MLPQVAAQTAAAFVVLAFAHDEVALVATTSQEHKMAAIAQVENMKTAALDCAPCSAVDDVVLVHLTTSAAEESP